MFCSTEGSIFVSSADQFWSMRSDLVAHLQNAPIVHGAKWQQLDVSQSDAHATRELLNVTFWYDMPETPAEAKTMIEPDLPWAEAHFQERVGGQPINPGEEHARWPYHKLGADLHLHGGKYDHNYMERYWPKGLTHEGISVEGKGDWFYEYHPQFSGYRFPVGDLNDVIAQLAADPTTRQAYLPVWFPEDTGAQSGQRVPCTLGYHFIVREGKLHVQYNIRSCDVYRHFTNDVYMTVRLGQFVRNMIANETGVIYEMGQLTMHVVSMHTFIGDANKIEWMVD